MRTGRPGIGRARRAPAAVQERLIAAIAALPAADRRALARSLEHLARMVAPGQSARHPPMLFEDGRRRTKTNRDQSR